MDIYVEINNFFHRVFALWIEKQTNKYVYQPRIEIASLECNQPARLFLQLFNYKKTFSRKSWAVKLKDYPNERWFKRNIILTWRTRLSTSPLDDVMKASECHIHARITRITFCLQFFTISMNKILIELILVSLKL